jgi:hypothetical protein
MVRAFPTYLPLALRPTAVGSHLQVRRFVLTTECCSKLSVVCRVSPCSDNLHWNFAHTRPTYLVFGWLAPTSGTITLAWPRKWCIDNDPGSTFHELRILIVREKWGGNFDSVKWYYSTRRWRLLITTIHNLWLPGFFAYLRLVYKHIILQKR